MNNLTNTCGCCAGIQQITPTPILNRPGLSALAYRMGIQATFLETMLARLSNMGIPLGELDTILDDPSKAHDLRYPLQGLTTRDLDDPSIAMLDAWAIVADVLTFYQERIANEGYLRTATERRSVLELTRLIGYTLRPGVAASVFLAYTLETGQSTTIPTGSRVQSLPGPGQLPQSFETSSDLDARAEWNAIKPRMSVPQYITQVDKKIFPFVTEPSIDTDTADGSIYLDGTSTRLKVNDLLLFVFSNDAGQQVIGKIQSVDPHAAEKYTSVRLLPEFTPLVYLRKLSAIFEHYLNFALFNISPTDTLLSPIVAILQNGILDLQQDLTISSTPEAQMQIFAKRPGSLYELLLGRDTWKILASAYTNAITSHSTASTAWLGGLIRDLQALLKALFPQAPSSIGGIVPIITTDAAALVRPLAQLPSIQPRNTIRLQRTPANAFARKSDIHLQLISTLNQRVGSSIYTAISQAATTAPAALQAIYTFRVKAVPFGSTTPLQTTVTRTKTDATSTTTTGATTTTTDTKTDITNTNYNEWTLANADQTTSVLYLDAEYNQIALHSWLYITSVSVPDNNNTPTNVTLSPGIYQIKQVETVARADYGISAKVTKLTLNTDWFTIATPSTPTLGAFRGVTIYAQSEILTSAEEPLTEDIQGDTIELDGLYDGLQSGRWVAVSGERTDIVNTQGIVTSELAMLASVTQETRPTNTQPPTDGTQGTQGELPQQGQLPGDTTHTFLHFATPLSYTYKRSTVTVGANVVKATHGETKNEVLGSGNGAVGMQQFTLKQSPVTYLAATTAAGASSTLHVYVDDIEWHEIDNLDGQGPKARVFVTQTDNQAKTTIIFGNGIQGVRPPTGAENVRAAYRVHLGAEGNVDAQQIKLLATRPLGVKGVINPLAATGGADRESRDQARSNAPLTVQALDRVVSIQDYADFARTFAGIAKANALTLSNGRQQLVHLTIAGQNNMPIAPTSDLYQNLFQALRILGNPGEPLRLEVCETKLLVISTRVRLLPDYQLESVIPAIRAALLNAFGFEQRDLGQPVYQSEVLSIIQQVPGVAFVDLDILDGITQAKLLPALDTIHQQELQAAATGQKADETQDLLNLLNLHVRQVVPARLAQASRNQPGSFLPAQLAFLTPAIPDTLIINPLPDPIFFHALTAKQ